MLTMSKGRQEFPNEEPQILSTSNSSNDTDIMYLLDPVGSVTLGTVLKEDGTASSFASKTISQPVYGRFKNVTVTSGTLYAYRIIPVNSES